MLDRKTHVWKEIKFWSYKHRNNNENLLFYHVKNELIYASVAKKYQATK